MTCRCGLAICVAVSLAGDVLAQELALTATMSDGSRFFEYISDSFAQVNAAWPDETSPDLDCQNNGGQPCDGFFLISSLPNLVAIGGGDRIFTRGPNLALGTLEYDDSLLTGAGLETAAITAFGEDADYAVDIGGDDLVSESLGPYSTSVDQSSVDGLVRFYDGVLVGIELEANVVFDVPLPIFPGNIVFEGAVRFDDHRFSLVVGPDAPMVNTFDYVWDIHGFVNQVLPGDYDNNGTVEGADYQLWRSEYGNTVEPFTASDGNDDGAIDAADYTVWRDNLGLTSSEPLAAASTTPEPVSAWLLALAAFIASLARHKGIGNG